MAVFSFTATSYDVDEQAGPAVMVVELSGCDLTFSIDILIDTVGAGSARGTLGYALVVLYVVKFIFYQFTENR